MFGSYNKFDARVHVDAHIVSVVDFLTSILASVVVFSTPLLPWSSFSLPELLIGRNQPTEMLSIRIGLMPLAGF